MTESSLVDVPPATYAVVSGNRSLQLTPDVDLPCYISRPVGSITTLLYEQMFSFFNVTAFGVFYIALQLLQIFFSVWQATPSVINPNFGQKPKPANTVSDKDGSSILIVGDSVSRLISTTLCGISWDEGRSKGFKGKSTFCYKVRTALNYVVETSWILSRSSCRALF